MLKQLGQTCKQEFDKGLVLGHLPTAYSFVWDNWVNDKRPDIAPYNYDELFDSYIETAQYLYEDLQREALGSQTSLNLTESDDTDYIDLVLEAAINLDEDSLKIFSKIIKAIKSSFVILEFRHPTIKNLTVLKVSPKSLARILISKSQAAQG